MPKFKYTAVNKQNKTLSGVIDALDQNAAQTQLNTMGMSVLDIAEAKNEQASDEGKIVFNFSATDKSGKNISGTIKSSDEISAYKKLTDEYEFTVKELSSTISGMINQANIEELAKQAQGPSPVAAPEAAAPPSEKRDIEIKVEQMMQQVQTSLEKMKDKLKPEAKQQIKKQIDKLQLIKSSTNIEYIKESAEKLLQEVQKQENYITTEGVTDEKGKLALETQKLMMEIQRGENTGGGSISEQLSSKIKKLSNVELNEKTGFLKKLTKNISDKAVKMLEVPQEVKDAKAKIALVKSQIWDYRKKWFTQKNNRTEIEKALNTLQAEKRRLQENLQKVKEKIYKEKDKNEASTAKTGLINSLVAFNTFTGWLLAFYLLYYAIGFLLVSKNFGFNASLSWNFNVFSVPILKEFVIVAFILHSSTALKITFFRHNRLASLLIFIGSIAITILALLNL